MRFDKMTLSTQLESPSLKTEMLPNQKLPLSVAFADAPLTDTTITNLFKELAFADNQLEIQENETEEFTQKALLKMMKHVNEQMKENRVLQLANIQLQGMLASERTLHQKEICVYKEEVAHHQNEIAKLSQELLEAKREAETRIEQTIKEKEAAVLTATKASEATVKALKLEQQSRWISHLQLIKTEAFKWKSREVNLYAYGYGHLRDKFEPCKALVNGLIYDKISWLFSKCKIASGIKFGYSEDPYNVTPAEPQ